MDTTDKTEPPPAGKCCDHCRINLTLDQFGRDLRQVDGLNPTCKICRRAEAKRWRVDHPEKAAWKSAREVCIREHGRTALTPELIAAKAAELAEERAAQAERRETRQVPFFETPPGTYTLHTLCATCGISISHLRKHRLLNSGGIGDAAFRWKRDFENTLVLFGREAAAPFIALMAERKVKPDNHSSLSPAAEIHLPAEAA